MGPEITQYAPLHGHFSKTAAILLLVRPDNVIFDEIRESRDFSVFVDAGFDVTLARALSRDLALFGSEGAVRERYERRYIPGETMYLKRCRPFDHADAVVRNNDPANAGLEWKRGRGT